MIAGLDSSADRPSAAIARQARADGISLWSGYLQSRAGVGIYSAWDRQSFENARLCGGTPIAWASGWDDPVACRQLADAWNLRLGLDVEGGGLRPDGPWIQGWLDAADAGRTGLYGNYWVFQHGYRAGFYVVGGYPGSDPGSTWGYTARPAGPCGWQWQGTHSEYGLGVDRGWYDDWFLGVAPPASKPALGGGMLLFHPTDINRIDQVVVGTDGALYHRQSSHDTHALAAASWALMNAGPFLALSATASWKASGDYLALEAIAEDGKIWQALYKADGSLYSAWEAGPGQARQPAIGDPGRPGSPGPAGPSYDDSALRSKLQKAADSLAAAAADLAA